jgi:hypothetical protein
MTWNTNVFDVKHLRISSSVHEMRMSFFTISAKDFAIISLNDLITHTFRARKNVLSFFWQMIVVNSKSSSIYSAKSTRNEFHKSLSNNSSHSRILSSRIWSLDSYFSFDFWVCFFHFIDFSLLLIKTRFRLANDDENDDSSSFFQLMSDTKLGLILNFVTCKISMIL